MSSLDQRIEKALRDTHNKLVSTGKMLSSERRQASFDIFRERFGPDRLRSLDGRELLHTMHTHGNQDSLVYWVEFKNDDEFKGLSFGGISGGSAHAFGIFRRKNTDQWVKGSPRNEENITEAEAIVIARKHRDQLIAGAALLEALPAQASDSEYLALQKALVLQAPDLASRAWAHKYLFLIHPNKLDDFHNERYQRYYLMKLLQEPPVEDGLYVSGGRFIRLANELGWTVNELTSVVNEINGKPKPYWRIGTKIGGSYSIWEEMKAGNYIAVGWDKMGDLSTFTDNRDWKDKKTALTQLEEMHYPDEAKNVASRQAGELLNFVDGMSEGEIVIAGDGEQVLGIGRVVGPYFYDGSAGTKSPHRRSVEWISFDPWRLLAKDGPRTTVWELKKVKNQLEIEKKIYGAPPIPPQPKSDSEAPVISVKPRLEGIPGRIHAILKRKGQAILYGPPGTGKTFWARETAYDLAAIETYGRSFKDLSPVDKAKVAGSDDLPGLVRCCTFHPAYGYEDFIEGYRPQPSPSGQLTFLLKDGIFKSICDDARKAPESQKYILLIDEINRGDIPRIFGELLTLLEVDKRGISLNLALSGKSFSVPKNVYVLGTMNTADRSIALLDTALRRRFGFVELMPDTSVFGNAVVDGGIPLGPWLNALNERIRAHLGRDGRNLQVGHAYLLHDGKPVTDMSRFARVLADDLIPLLEEYCYEDYSVLTRILGEGLVDGDLQCIREELFTADRWDELVQALLSQSPDIVTAFEAIIPGDSTEETEDEDVEDDES